MRPGAAIAVAVVTLAAPTLRGQTLEPLTGGVVPVVSRELGALGSQWSTTLYLTQTGGSTPASVTLTLLDPAGTDPGAIVEVPSTTGSAMVADVVTSIAPSLPDGKYILSWSSTQPVALSTRTFTMGASGSYGQGIASLAHGSGFGSGDQVTLPAPMDSAGHRVNVGVANSGLQEQTFSIEAVDDAGVVARTLTRTVPPHSIVQLRTNDGMDGAGSVVIRCESGCDGNAFAYASVVVNDSNDAYFVYGAPSSAEQPPEGPCPNEWEYSATGVLKSTDHGLTWTPMGHVCFPGWPSTSQLSVADPSPHIIDDQIVLFFLEFDTLAQPTKVMLRATSPVTDGVQFSIPTQAFTFPDEIWDPFVLRTPADTYRMYMGSLDGIISAFSASGEIFELEEGVRTFGGVPSMSRPARSRRFAAAEFLPSEWVVAVG
jgi:hypothetical protein